MINTCTDTVYVLYSVYLYSIYSMFKITVLQYVYCYPNSSIVCVTAPLDWLLLYRALADRRVRAEPHPHADAAAEHTCTSAQQSTSNRDQEMSDPSQPPPPSSCSAGQSASSSSHAHAKHSSARLTLEQFASIYEFAEFVWEVRSECVCE